MLLADAIESLLEPRSHISITLDLVVSGIGAGISTPKRLRALNLYMLRFRLAECGRGSLVDCRPSNTVFHPSNNPSNAASNNPSNPSNVIFTLKNVEVIMYRRTSKRIHPQADLIDINALEKRSKWMCFCSFRTCCYSLGSPRYVKKRTFHIPLH